MNIQTRIGLVLGVVSVLGAGVWALDSASLRDRTPIAPMPERVAEVEPESVVEPKTVEERLDALEQLARRLQRSVDPYDHRDEMRLENRIRELERTVQRLEQDLRRLEAAGRR